MQTRRTLIESAAAMLFLGPIVSAQNAPAQTGRRNPILQQDLPQLTLDNWAVTAVEVVYGPGERSASHSHPGITIVYVLEGEVRSQVGDQPERTYAVGEMFLEHPGERHGVSGNASDTKPARLLAVLLAEKGKPLTSPAE
jgi:quercetin dioxygenase-like cupin family protein